MMMVDEGKYIIEFEILHNASGNNVRYNLVKFRG